ncbi:AAA family ATPase [Escherichia coli]|uniref:AAA family ATPase n=1 Tax=Escherichia coli TaxID=562 RepID=UPI00202324DD|nr:AAA family ATPase [Escherichia coli]
MQNLVEFVTCQVPNRFVIRYRGKELKHHSLGQRASALLLYVLSQRQNDVIIIDQPEDDLDNQTIYDDVIKLLREMKPHAQFIFATHNANFPVLGDAEQCMPAAIRTSKSPYKAAVSTLARCRTLSSTSWKEARKPSTDAKRFITYGNHRADRGVKPWRRQPPSVQRELH